MREGGLTGEQQHRLSSAIDRYVAQAYDALACRITWSSVHWRDPDLPIYSESLVETLRRLSAGPVSARNLPRFADLVVYEGLVCSREPLASDGAILLLVSAGAALGVAGVLPERRPL